MKFVKTVLTWEYGGQRVIGGLGVVQFNQNGVCVIQDDDIADKVIAASRSLVEASEDDSAVAELLGNLSKEEFEKSKLASEDEGLRSFLSGEGSGVTVESSKVIGNPAPTEGKAAPIASADNLIGQPASDEDQTKGLLDSNGNPINKENDPTEDNGDDSDGTSEEELRAMLQEFSHGDIKSMLEESGINLKEKYTHDQIRSKEAIINVAIKEGIMSK